MGTPSQVRSGKTLERWTARWLQSLGFPKAARSHQDRQGSVQLGCVPDIIGVPVWVECKRLKHAKLDAALTLVRKAWAQSQRDQQAIGSALPILVVVSCGRTGALKLLAVDRLRVGAATEGPSIKLDHDLIVADFTWPTARSIEEWLRGMAPKA